mgnify:FL=1
MFQNLTNQQKGSLLAFVGVIFITPDSLFIRLANADTYQLLFYRGAIPFVAVFLALLIIYKSNFIRLFLNTGYPGIAYSLTFAITNITFIISIQNTNVANTLIMVALAPMFTAILSLIFLKENPEKKTWVAIIITTLAAIYIFYDSIQIGNFLGDIFGLITAIGLAAGAVIVRSAKNRNLVPSAVVGKLMVAVVAAFFVQNYELVNKDLIIVPAMCILCVAIPFVLVTIAPRFISAAEVNLFFLIEVILGPIWVWLVIKEQPSFETIIGGLVIIFTIGIHSILVIKKT